MTGERTMMTAKVLVMVAALALLASHAAARNVVVDVRAPWKRYSASSIAEIAEFIADESNELFWKYVDGMCKETERVESALQDSTVNDIQTLAFEVATSVVSPTFSPSMVSLMDTHLGLGGQIPAVRFFESLTESYYTSSSASSNVSASSPCDSSAFVVAYHSGTILCEEGELLAYFNSLGGDEAVDSVSPLYPQLDSDWDHIHPSAYNARNVQEHPNAAVLYGTIGTTKFCSLHAMLASLASSSSVRYAARHAFFGQEVVSTSARVQGYGIFLDIKNVEYKTVDDSNKQSAEAQSHDAGSSAGQQASFAEGEEVAGVIFSSLATRRPEIVEGLSVLRAELMNKIVEEGSEMKLWKIKEAGLQLVTVLMSSPTPVDKLADVVQNFPLHATSLTSVRVSDAVKKSFSSER
jgi:hypothetical protein